MLTNDPAFWPTADTTYDRWREQSPVHRTETPDGRPVWIVTRYADVRAAFTDPRLALDKTHSRSGYTGFALPPTLDANLLNLDPPDHTRLRRLVAQVFTGRRVERLRPAVEEHVEQLLAAVDPRGVTDLVSALAAPLPLRVIGELLGVNRLDRMRAWTDALLAPGPHQPYTPRQAITALEDHLRALIAARREHPDDTLTSALIAARDGSDRLDEDELTSLIFLILWAGYETTIDAIGTCVLALLRDPDLAGRLHSQPDDVPAAIEELLRLHGPTPLSIRRFATEDLTIGGAVIPAGDTVLLMIAGANRDPAVFDRPGRADVGRTPNPHLAFGFGIHHCLGAPLARVQLASVIGTLVRHYPGMALAIPADEIAWRPSFRARGLIALPTILTPT
jgi:cytochrome P450